MTSLKNYIPFWALFIFAACSFWILDSQAVSIGDDLGYYFTDSSIHNPDGKQLSSPEEIFITQMNHWKNCNGRFIIHSLVMFFLNFAGFKIFVICNALCFALLSVLTFRLILPGKRPAIISSLIVLLLLWLCLPRPGITMLSLMAYSINYLWSATALLFFILLWNNLDSDKYRKYQYLIPCYALLTGALQESFSLPLSAALLFIWVIQGKNISKIKVATMLCFFIGTALVFFAPGNLSHAQQGGAFSISALAAKNSALAKDIMFSSINLLAIILIIIALCAPGRFPLFCKRNTLLLSATIAALLLASVSYTAIRQLFAPSLFCAIIIGRIIFSFNPPTLSRIEFICMSAGLLLIYCGMIAGAYIIRQFPKLAIDNVISQVKEGKSVITLPPNPAEESSLFNFLFSRFNDDPTINADLKLLFDHYTKQGLSRLYSPAKTTNAVNTFLPASEGEILKLKNSLDTNYSEGVIKTTPLSPYYNLAIFPTDSSGKVRYKLETTDGRLVYERLRTNDSIIYILPNTIKNIIIKKQ